MARRQLVPSSPPPCIRAGSHSRVLDINQMTNDEASAALLPVAAKQPSKTFATPEDIGELAAFLCSKAANQITGGCALSRSVDSLRVGQISSATRPRYHQPMSTTRHQ